MGICDSGRDGDFDRCGDDQCTGDENGPGQSGEELEGRVKAFRPGRII